jgi:ornithine racemase
MYPNVTIDLIKLKENCIKMIDLCNFQGIDIIMPVVKVTAGDKKIAEVFVESGYKYLGDSRIQNLQKYYDLPVKKFLVRIPMLSEIKEVIAYSDISLNSEIETIEALNKEAKLQNKKHEIIIMFDLDDLREGYYYKDPYLDEISKILKLENIILKGIGTNLTCYGGLVPSRLILNRLVDIKDNIETNLKIKLEIISGGNSSSIYLFGKNEIPDEINSLRLGESIFLGKETAYQNEIKGFNYDVFSFEAQIIECKEKPSYPDGEISINSFGEKPIIEDKGLMKRAILAIGKQDVIIDNITPIDDKIQIIGASSDHLIIDITATNYKLGDIIEFKVNYPGLLHLMNSDYVYKKYKEKSQ